ncbi:MAG: hypothetical protein DSM107014_00055 [Gomphosphaeria aponina SAG 52.96 = DSM 107014]|uniref:Uncharacterized protein n=1 Tax=Gomphosphaeria aponina SAG 52.96 = DSM 107014 TaxID=1521640 RepID=A0A941GQU2_9CHRO|nr:hypothetical protein [Gomphosphaeria aponina SAG 52.96 = DSM 107014]
MSSVPNGPYKSRVFNFINRQYIRSLDRLGKTVRQLKSLGAWGVQIMLYPVYLLVQIGRLVGRQLGQRIEQIQAQLPSETGLEQPDKPLQAVLQTVKPWLCAEKNQPLLPESPGGKLIIHGVATLLETRGLVLVTTENQILPVLTQEQQQKLQQRMSWEIANFCREQRLNQTSVRRLPRITTNNPHLFGPVQLFWQVMSWMQRGSVAIAIDLFGESHLVVSSPCFLPAPIHPPLPANGFLATLDHTVADLEVQQLSPGKTASYLQALIKAAVDYFFQKNKRQGQLGSKEVQQISLTQNNSFLPVSRGIEGDRLPSSNQPINRIRIFMERLGNSLVLLVPKNPVIRGSHSNTAQPTTQPDPFEIKVLIQAAIAYFFGKNQGNLPETENHFFPENNPTNLQLPPDTLEDPWLSWEDLYGQEIPVAANQVVNLPPSVAILPQGRKTPKTLRKQQLFQRNLTKVQSQALQNTHAPVENSSNLPTQKPPQNLTEDFVETEAKSVGYVQHPLERILQWLDRAILWLEELLVTIWRKLKRK